MNPQAIAAAIHRARQLDLHASTLQVLCILSATGPSSLHHLSAELEITGAALTNIADRLESLRYAARTQTRHDRRGITLTITDHGREALADIIRDATAASWENLTPA
jgi:DNA-binding MarR family transcriptional regulator